MLAQWHSPPSPPDPAGLAPDLARADDLPLGAQLAWRLRVLIASGQLGPGDRLPGVRELAEGAGVNVNTARAVYRRLTDDGLIASRHGLGTFVADDAPGSPELERLAADAADSARASGVDPRDLARAIYTGEWRVAESSPRPMLVRGRRRAARAGESFAARSPASRRSLPPTRRPASRASRRIRCFCPKGHVADMAELEQTRDELIERLTRAREEAERRGERQGEARARLESMTADPAGHRWEIVSRQEIGEPGCATWEVAPRWGPIGALMNWWRVRSRPDVHYPGRVRRP